MSDQAKFWIQTLIIPVVIAGIGYIINQTLQNQQREFEKIKFADQVINEAFDSNNPDKALALTKIIPLLIDDKPFLDSIISLINKYYEKKAELAIKYGNVEQYRRISDAAATFAGKGINLSQLLAENSVTSKAEEAHEYEKIAMVQVQEGNLEEAQSTFRKAEKTFPGFHISYEIANLLKSKISEVEAGANKEEIKQQVLDIIQKKYSRKFESGASTPVERVESVPR